MIELLTVFRWAGKLFIHNDGMIGFEWPRKCTYWKRPDVMTMIAELGLTCANFDGCAFGLRSSLGGHFEHFLFFLFFLFFDALTLLHISKAEDGKNMRTAHDLLNLKLNHCVIRPGEADSNCFVFALSTFSLLLSLALASSLLAGATMGRKQPAGTALMTPRAAVYPASPQKCGFPQ
jgi:hypothetical protein